jgi:putative FmdB family regulatory protein
MPIYEYECRRCRSRFEFLVIPSSPVASCPSCGKKDLKQLISLCAVSSEATRQANIKSARKKATSVHKEKQHEEHKALHHDH